MTKNQKWDERNKNYNFCYFSLIGGHLPKEGKEVAAALVRFKANLERVAEYSYNPLPALAAQAVHFVFWGSLIFGAITVEKTNFDNIGWPGAILVSSFNSHIKGVFDLKANQEYC